MKNAIKTGFGIYIGFKLCEKLTKFLSGYLYLAGIRLAKKKYPDEYKAAVAEMRMEDEKTVEAVFTAYPDLAI